MKWNTLDCKVLLALIAEGKLTRGDAIRLAQVSPQVMAYWLRRSGIDMMRARRARDLEALKLFNRRMSVKRPRWRIRETFYQGPTGKPLVIEPSGTCEF
jgi:hypothetical protein